MGVVWKMKTTEFDPARLKKTGDGFYLAYGSDFEKT